MKLSGLFPGHTVLLVGGVTLACALCAESHRSTGQDHISVLSENVRGEEEGEASGVKVCGAQRQGGGAARPQLDLEAKVNTTLHFSCGKGETLAPAGSVEKKTSFKKFYAYSKEGGCNVGSPHSLQEQNIGAILETESNLQSRVPISETVYTFRYTTEPEAEKHLCYTCNTAAPHNADPNLKLGSEAGDAACTVHITVPKKAATTAAPTETATSSTSNAGASSTYAATATGGLLAVVLHM